MKTIKSVVLSQREYDILKNAQSILSNICCEFEQGNEMEQCQMCPLHFCCDYDNSEDSLPNNLYYLIRNLQVETNEKEN